MARLCSRSERCSADVHKKITAEGIESELADEIIEKLIAGKFIDDERYVKAYVNDKFKFNQWGKIKMRHYLQAKGLSNEIINDGLETIDKEKYKKTLIKVMKTKAKTIKKKDKFEKMGQIIRFAQNRGFEPELIHRYMDSVLS